ncbi:hypothetical protein BB560_000569 [Smittium megazygosporum]|uniref:Lysophospholipase NTE1 n=1 Tax=Smittium megazygosporum TaxID=133381 RepID=A0A2T9ZJZ3_9FUNG|nr:hypothetical protein BB560_000569 [Smittium megazygosporum]
MRFFTIHNVVLLLLIFTLGNLLVNGNELQVIPDSGTPNNDPNKEPLTIQKIKSELKVEQGRVKQFYSKHIKIFFSLSVIKTLFQLLEFLMILVLRALYILLLLFRVLFSSFKSGVLALVCISFSSIYIIRNYLFPKAYKSEVDPNFNTKTTHTESNDLSDIQLQSVGINTENQTKPLDDLIEDDSPSSRISRDINGYLSQNAFNNLQFVPSLNFLDTFLRSIQIFGYLEDDVFYEMSRQLQTQRVLAGESILCIEETNDFCVVAEGLVNVYAVDEVFPDGQIINKNATTSALESSPLGYNRSQTGFLLSSPESSSRGLVSKEREPSVTAYTNHQKKFLGKIRKGTILSSLLNVMDALSHFEIYSKNYSQHQKLRKTAKIKAIAAVDTTLVIIPEKAFKRVKQKFPKAAAQIIRVILSRLQKISLHAVQSYFNLKNEGSLYEDNDKQGLETGSKNRLSNKHSKTFFSQPSEIDLSDSYLEFSKESIPDLLTKNDTITLNTFTLEKFGEIYFLKDSKSLSTPSTNLNVTQEEDFKSSHIDKHSIFDDVLKTRDHSFLFDPVNFVKLREDVKIILSDILGLNNTTTEDQIKSQSRSLNAMHLINRFGHKDHLLSTGANSDSDTADNSPSFGNNKKIRVFPNIGAQKPYLPGKQSEPSLNSPSTNTKVEMAFSGMEIVFFSSGNPIIKQGHKTEGIYLVLAGYAELYESSISSDQRYSGLNVSTESIGGEYGIKNEESVAELAKSMTEIASKVQKVLHPYTDFQQKVNPKEIANMALAEDSSMGDNQQTENIEKKLNLDQLENYESSSEDNSGEYNATSKPSLVGPGGILGFISAVTGLPSNVTAIASTCACSGASTDGAILAFLPMSSISSYITSIPELYIELAGRVSNSLTRLIYHVDYALEFQKIPGGKIIYTKGNKANTVHLVLSGRLRAISEKNSNGDSGYFINEFGQGESVGEPDVLGNDQRSFSLYTIRDSEIILIPKTIFSILVSAYPKLTFHISKLIASHMVGGSIGKKIKFSSNSNFSLETNSFQSLSTQNQPFNFNKPLLHDHCNYNSNLKTICILPMSDFVPIGEFSLKLHESLAECFEDTFALINSASVLKKLGKDAFKGRSSFQTNSWLTELEQKYRLVLYVADSGLNSVWTRICIRQADCILIVGLGDGNPSLGPYEHLLLSSKSRARKELVLLHSERFCTPGSTKKWLSERKWVYAYHHIQMPHLVNEPETASKNQNGQPRSVNRIYSFFIMIFNQLALFFKVYSKALFSRKSEEKKDSSEKNKPNVKASVPESKNQIDPNLYKNLLEEQLLRNKDSTFLKIKGRFERYYTNFTRKKRQYSPSPYKGYRSDFSRLARRLCNKSVGLVMSGGGARGMALLGVLRAFEEAGIPVDIVGGTSIGAFFSGLYAQESDSVAIWRRAKLFANLMKSVWRKIFDLTLPILSYTSGNEFNRALWKIFKEVEIEDLWLPFYCVSTNITHSCVEIHKSGYLWKYLRASMSLSGFLPPLCDSEGQMLVDGGYMDNLPVSYMYNELGANIIFAVDIAGETDTNPVYYGEAISGLGIFFNNLNPFRKYKVPNLSDIQSRLAYVSGIQTLRDVKNTPGVIYLRIPPKEVGVLDFSKFNSTYKKGYVYALSWIEGWKTEGKLSAWSSYYNYHGLNKKNSLGKVKKLRRVKSNKYINSSSSVHFSHKKNNPSLYNLSDTSINLGRDNNDSFDDIDSNNPNSHGSDYFRNTLKDNYFNTFYESHDNEAKIGTSSPLLKKKSKKYLDYYSD